MRKHSLQLPVNELWPSFLFVCLCCHLGFLVVIVQVCLISVQELALEQALRALPPPSVFANQIAGSKWQILLAFQLFKQGKLLEN